ncbi:WecB/TagA/CpsF family glycosyltransferase [Candidatus Daviesbacteria bacterium]|nr:WecB/TagA/CpsF family glycosyltransferase [Candidatus Daviesbacteria bacterium]
MRVDILGVKIDDIDINEALTQVEEWICPDGSFHRGSSTNEIRREKHYVVTPNPEFLVAAQKDPIFKKILNDADLSVPDGAGLKLSGKIKNTFSGTDFMERLIEVAAEKGFVVGFLGGKDGVAEKVAECLKRKYPALKVLLTSADTKSLIPPLDLLFVALGHVKQEKWIADNLDKIPVHLAMGVGGAFDYLSGEVRRAPKWMRDLGFEWLFRLILQPWRIKRQMALGQYILYLLAEYVS